MSWCLINHKFSEEVELTWQWGTIQCCIIFNDFHSENSPYVILLKELMVKFVSANSSKAFWTPFVLLLEKFSFYFYINHGTFWCNIYNVISSLFHRVIPSLGMNAKAASFLVRVVGCIISTLMLTFGRWFIWAGENIQYQNLSIPLLFQFLFTESDS